MKSVASIENNLSSLGSLNHRLADEVAKLPEIRKFKTHSSRLALSNLLEIYRFAPDGFDCMFDAMDETGMLVHRSYCSPLQALFWLIQDGEMSASGMLLGLKIKKFTDKEGHCRPRLISVMKPSNRKDDSAVRDHHYTLEKVLDAAWKDERLLMQSENIHRIIHRIQTRQETEEYALLVKRHDALQLQGYIMDDFLRKRKVFDVKDWRQIETAIAQSRWKVFYSVADRLNAPELVSHYINNFLSFRKNPTSGVHFTFFDKTAQCTDAAYFAKFMLDRAGYKTFMRSVKWDEDPWDGLHTGAGIVLEDGRYLLVSNYTGINSMSGPFSSLESLDRKLSCGRSIVGRKWGAYFPPRFY